MSNDTQTPGGDETQIPSKHAPTTTAAKPKSKTGLIGLLVIVGALLIAALVMLPWYLRGSNQAGVVTTVKAAGGRTSYGVRLSDDATYGVNEKKGGERGFVENLMGEAYTEKLTQIIWNKASFDSAIVNRIANLPALEIVDLSGPVRKDGSIEPTNLSDTDFESLCRCQTIKKLWANGGQISDVGIAGLATLPDLQSLSLDHTGISDVALDVISSQANLKRLYLEHTEITDKGVAKLEKLAKLQGIGLQGTKATNGAIDTLVKLTDLEEVRLGDTSIGAAVAKLVALPKLKELNLEGTDVTDADLSWLADCENLEKVWLSRTKVTDNIASTLQKMPKLLLVHLNDTAITKDGWSTMRRRLGRDVQVQIEAYEELVEINP